MTRRFLFKLIVLLIAWPAIAKAQQDRGRRTRKPALEVMHFPDPCPVNKPRRGKKVRRSYVWYYRTQVRNNSQVPLQIIHFENYSLVKGRWVASNVLGRALTGKDFAQWYTEGSPAPEGWIGPGATAVCDPNWTWHEVLIGGKTKWRFTAQDEQGKTYHAEAVIELSTRT